MTTLSSWGNLGHLEGTSPDGAFEVGSIAIPQVQSIAPNPQPDERWFGFPAVPPRYDGAGCLAGGKPIPPRSVYPPIDTPQLRRYPLIWSMTY